ncbi:hypothetical protein LINPERPRIM_LOCUS4169 [Linum perenne]
MCCLYYFLLLQGLIQALDRCLPHVEHRKCARHLFANWKLKHGTAEAKEAFWKAVYSSNQVEYDKHANRLKQLQDDDTDRKAYDDFIKQEPKRFCRAFLSTAAKSDSVESNVCESFNNAITKFRDLRIIKLLEGIRTYIMVRMVEQHKAFAAMRDASKDVYMLAIYLEFQLSMFVQPVHRRKNRCKHCKHFGHNIRGCPARRGVRPDQIGINTPRPVVEREIRQAMRGVGVHVSPETGNQYFASGAGVRLEEVDIKLDVINQSQQPGTQPPNTHPRSSG